MRVKEIDGLRGLAVLLVVIFHYTYKYNQIYGHSFEPSHYFEYARFGVQLFFIISGFVIFYSLSSKSCILSFGYSRFKRLYPTYWFSLVLVYFVVCYFGLDGRTVEFGDFAYNFLMFHEYLGVPHVDGVYWSLTVELTFYLIISIAFFKLNEQIDTVLIIWVCLSLFTYAPLVDESLILKVFRKVLILKYISYFAIGIVLYRLYELKSVNKQQCRYKLILILPLSLFAIYLNDGVHFLLFTIFALLVLLSLLLIECKMTKIISGVLNAKALTYFGTISYSLYLVHQNIGYVLLNFLYSMNIYPLLSIMLTLLFIVLLSHLIYQYVESNVESILGQKA